MSNRVTSRDPMNTPLAWRMVGNDKWGYAVHIYDTADNSAQVGLVPNNAGPLDWDTPKEAAIKAAAVLRELADLLEASV